MLKFYDWRLTLCGLIVLALVISTLSSDSIPTENLTNKEKHKLMLEAKEMFYHAYNAYMDNAYPADELMPLSCKGRFRGVTASRGDMDDILGNFSMTLVDTLDTLVLLGDFKEFERGVKLVVEDVSFDNNIIVSVFETNIRMIGGLLSAHILSEYLQQNNGLMNWYRGELLEMAKDLGYRLLPAFNTSTGIPHARVNLKHGMKVDELKLSRETCTACAGTILLEFAALSRLSGEPVFEIKAHAAMDALWKLRHRGSDLMGTVVNVHSGDWVRRDSGVGAGIDSYYEYCLKSYVLLGDDRYLVRFNRHYSAIMKYISQGPMFLDVHMHRPHAKSRNFMDALLAFWPGLQVLSGDLKPAVQTHEMLYQVMQMHTFLPEAFTFDFQIHWGQHYLRPEFIESTYFLYKATGDHYYLHVGKKVLESLQNFARVKCGFASVNDVRTGRHEDRMDSFVLSETLKYLFLLFAEESDVPLNLDKFIFTTEAHLLPLSLGQFTNYSGTVYKDDDDDIVMDFRRSCPSTSKLFPKSVRKPLKNLVSGVCPASGGSSSRRLRAQDFQSNNVDHLRTVYEMGITLVSLTGGKVQLLHNFHNAKSPEDAERGLLFMQEMLELSKTHSMNSVGNLQAVFFQRIDRTFEILMAGPSHFSPELKGNEFLRKQIVYADPFKMCTDIVNGHEMASKIAIIERGECTFIDKARKAQAAGASGVIIIDDVRGTTADNQPMFVMSGDGKENVTIPVVFLFSKEGEQLRQAWLNDTSLQVNVMEMMGLKRILDRIDLDEFLQSADNKTNQSRNNEKLSN